MAVPRGARIPNATGINGRVLDRHAGDEARGQAEAVGVVRGLDYGEGQSLGGNAPVVEGGSDAILLGARVASVHPRSRLSRRPGVGIGV